jgi:hypothetical protein
MRQGRLSDSGTAAEQQSLSSGLPLAKRCTTRPAVVFRGLQIHVSSSMLSHSEKVYRGSSCGPEDRLRMSELPKLKTVLQCRQSILSADVFEGSRAVVWIRQSGDT